MDTQHPNTHYTYSIAPDLVNPSSLISHRCTLLISSCSLLAITAYKFLDDVLPSPLAYISSIIPTDIVLDALFFEFRLELRPNLGFTGTPLGSILRTVPMMSHPSRVSNVQCGLEYDAMKPVECSLICFDGH